MKKVLLTLALMLTAVVSLNAQILRAEELEKYAKEKYGDKWVEAASNLGKQLTLDKNNAIDYVQVMEAPVASRTSEFAHLEWQLDAADADIELVNKRLDEAQGKCHYLVNAT